MATPEGIDWFNQNIDNKKIEEAEFRVPFGYVGTAQTQHGAAIVTLEALPKEVFSREEYNEVGKKMESIANEISREIPCDAEEVRIAFNYKRESIREKSICFAIRKSEIFD